MDRRQITMPTGYRFPGNQRMTNRPDRRRHRFMRWLWMPLGRVAERFLQISGA